MIKAVQFFSPLKILAFAWFLPFALSAAHASTPQESFIQKLGDDAIAVLADKALTPEAREEKFRNLMRSNFDLKTIGRFVLGRNWNAATAEQRDEYVNLFEALVVKTYSNRFTLYTGEGFEVLSSTPEGKRDYIVNSQITRPDGGPPVAVAWRVREKDGSFGIIDVMVEGVSMSVTQRQEYAAVIQRNGGDLEALLALMRKRAESKEGEGLKES